MAGEGGPMGVGQQFSETEILGLSPRDMHSMVQCTCRNEGDKKYC